MRHLDLFSGIGGFALATEMVWEDVEHVFCDNDPFAQEILKKHWPECVILGDIKTLVTCLQTPNTNENGEKSILKKEGSIGTGTIKKTKKNSNQSIKKEQKSEDAQKGKLSSGITEDNALAAESLKSNSSTSTIKTMMGISSEDDTEQQEPMLDVSKLGFPTHIKYSALTATLQNQYIKYVLTKEPVDLLTGGFPCQPFSQAGRRKGEADDRFLWPYLIETIRLVRPRICLLENVAGILSISDGRVFEQVCTDLESEGYEVGAFVIPVAAVGAPHRRDRVWIAAHAIGSDALRAPRLVHSTQEGERIQERDEVGKSGEQSGARVSSHAKHDGFDGTQDGEGDIAGGNCDPERAHEFRQPERADSIWEITTDSASLDEERRDIGQGQKQFRRSDWEQDWVEVATTLCRMDDGLSRRLDRNPRLKGLGNAIVPQVAAEVLKAIRDMHDNN